MKVFLVGSTMILASALAAAQSMEVGPPSPGIPYCLGDDSAQCPCTDTSLVMRETFAVNGVLPAGWSGAATVTSTCVPGSPCLSPPYLYMGFPPGCSLGFGTVHSP